MEELTHIINKVVPKPKYLFFDTETTGLLPPCNDPINNALRFPRIVQLSWDFCDVEKDYIIKPDGWVIPEAASRVHGITTAKAKEVGFPAHNAIEDVRALKRCYWELVKIKIL